MYHDIFNEINEIDLMNMYVDPYPLIDTHTN